MIKLTPELFVLKYIMLFDGLPARYNILFRVLYDIKKNPKYSKQLKEFKFWGSPVAPFCEALDEGISNLMFSNIVYYDNRTKEIKQKEAFLSDHLLDEIKLYENSVGEGAFESLCKEVHHYINELKIKEDLE